jgi:hypothetical protein
MEKSPGVGPFHIIVDLPEDPAPLRFMKSSPEAIIPAQAPDRVRPCPELHCQT